MFRAGSARVPKRVVVCKSHFHNAGGGPRSSLPTMRFPSPDERALRRLPAICRPWFETIRSVPGSDAAQQTHRTGPPATARVKLHRVSFLGSRRPRRGCGQRKRARCCDLRAWIPRVYGIWIPSLSIVPQLSVSAAASRWSGCLSVPSRPAGPNNLLMERRPCHPRCKGRHVPD